MDELDLKIQNALSKNLDISDDFQRIYNAIEGFPEHYEKNKTSYMKKIIQFIKYIIIGTSLIGATVFAYNEIQKNETKKVEPKVSEVTTDDNKLLVIAENGFPVNILNSDEWKFSYHNQNNYLKINNLEEYELFKEKYKDIFEMEEMTQDDFNDETLFIILLEGYSKGNINIFDIYSEENILHIIFSRRFSLSDEIELKKAIFVKVPKELDREIVEIQEFPTEEYKLDPSIKEIVENNYSREDIINSNDYVIEEFCISSNGKQYLKIVSNEDKLENFIRETKNGNEMEIGIINFSENHKVIYNLKYENGYYFLYKYEEENINNETYARYEFAKGKEIRIDYTLIEDIESYDYWLEEKLYRNDGYPIELDHYFCSSGKEIQK